MAEKKPQLAHPYLSTYILYSITRPSRKSHPDLSKASDDPLRPLTFFHSRVIEEPAHSDCPAWRPKPSVLGSYTASCVWLASSHFYRRTVHHLLSLGAPNTHTHSHCTNHHSSHNFVHRIPATAADRWGFNLNLFRRSSHSA